MRIDDFEPEVVEVLLRNIYNGSVLYSELDNIELSISLMKISDKYNFTILYDTIDSQLAQEINHFF